MFLSYDPLRKKYLWIGIFVFILVIGIALRLWHLPAIPPGLNQDESAIGYNAYSIVQTGKDEWGVKYPLYFKSFGDYKLPAYIYTVALFVKLIGLNVYAVRLPSAIAGVISIALLFFLVRSLSKNTTIALISSFLLALNPQYLLFSRAAFEVNFALMWILLAILLFIYGADRKKIVLLFLSILSFGVAFYSYNVMRLLIPLFVTGLIVLYFNKIRTFHRVVLGGLIIFTLIILTPFFTTFFTPQGVSSAKDALITSTDITAKNFEMRSYLSAIPPRIIQILYNKYFFMLFQYMQNLALILSGAFYFVSGTQQATQGIGNAGVFYLFELPFMICGIIIYFSLKLKPLRIIFWWLMGTVAILALSKEVPHATRGYMLIIPGIVFSALGLHYFIFKVRNMRRLWMRWVIFASVFFFILFNIQFVLSSFFFRFPIVYANNWRAADKELSLYIKSKELNYDHVLISDGVDYIYSSYMFYNRYPPVTFQTKAHWYQDGLLSKVNAWDNIEIKTITLKDFQTPHTLIITSPEERVKNFPRLNVISVPKKHIVLSVNGSILNTEEDGTRYVIIDTDAIPPALFYPSDLK